MAIKITAIMPAMVIAMIKTTEELMQEIAERVKGRRLALNFTQLGVSERSGVSLGTIKRFEHTGRISLESLLKLAMALGATKEFELLFTANIADENISLDELLIQPAVRKRGRVS